MLPRNSGADDGLYRTTCARGHPALPAKFGTDVHNNKLITYHPRCVPSRRFYASAKSVTRETKIHYALYCARLRRQATIKLPPGSRANESRRSNIVREAIKYTGIFILQRTFAVFFILFYFSFPLNHSIVAIVMDAANESLGQENGFRTKRSLC